MKRVLALLFTIVFSVLLVACDPVTYEIAMITDTGDIDDGSFNQGTWEGIKRYAEEKGKSYQYYKPAGESDEQYLAAIDLAVSGGAKIVITPGFYFERPVYEAQIKYPDVKFVLIDGEPRNADGDSDIKSNTLAVYFQEEQAAFIAAYATYRDGKKNLGYMGGIAVPAVQRFGIGWVAGAYYAAKEAGDNSYKFNPTYYTYLGTFGPSDTYKTQAGAWYDAGVEAIHAAAGGAGLSVMAAAGDRQNKYVIGVDSDQRDASSTVLTSAVKGVGEAAYEALDAFFNDKFEGGKSITLGVKENAAGIPALERGRFASFTQALHDALVAKIKTDEIVVPATADDLVEFIADLGFTLTEQEANALKTAIAGGGQ